MAENMTLTEPLKNIFWLSPGNPKNSHLHYSTHPLFFCQVMSNLVTYPFTSNSNFQKNRDPYISKTLASLSQPTPRCLVTDMLMEKKESLSSRIAEKRYKSVELVFHSHVIPTTNPKSFNLMRLAIAMYGLILTKQAVPCTC